MTKFKLSDSQKLMVFLGGMNVVGRKLEGFETEEEKEELSKAMIENRLKAIEIVRTREQAMRKEISDLRVQIVDMLNRSGEVSDISDMFEDVPSFIDFNPIIFTMHLPISLQKMHQEEPDGAHVEDFVLAYDGRLVMVAVVCSSEERPWGVYDTRDRLIQTLKSVVPNLEMTAPCLTHEAIVFLNKPEEVDKGKMDIYLKMEPREEVVDVLRKLYKRLTPGIMFFYSACDTTEETTKINWEIGEHEAKLLSSLREFLATTWRHPLKRTKIVGKMKTHAIKILEGLSVYSSLIRKLGEARSRIEEHRAHSSLFNSFIEKIKLDEYTKPNTVDSQSLMRIIEHARSETETYGLSTSTLVSTLVGAFIGSVLTITVSYFLGIL